MEEWEEGRKEKWMEGRKEGRKEGTYVCNVHGLFCRILCYAMLSHLFVEFLRLEEGWKGK